MAMLHQDNKHKIIFFLFFILLFSCNNRRLKQYNDFEIRNNSFNFSKTAIGEENYWKIYHQLNDTINNWRKYKLRGYDEDTTKVDFRIDSILCFSKNRNKMIATRIGRDLCGGVMDGIVRLYGIKIDELWYFFSGPTLFLPRKYYQDDIHTPLSFEKLKQIAASNIYRRYLTQNRQGEWEINERFFDQIIPSKRTLEIYNLKDEEEYVKWIVGLKWENHRKIDENK